MEGAGLGVGITRVLTQALPVTIHMVAGKLFNLCKPQFPKQLFPFCSTHLPGFCEEKKLRCPRPTASAQNVPALS